jgi:phage shock protein PspC (stress-responsive transcriptional regulator)
MNTSKRFFQRKDGAILSGLCSGIAAYVGVNPNYVRIWWLGMSFFIGAKTILIYAVLMCVVPYAKGDARSTALIDVETLKTHVMKGDVDGLRAYFVQMWNDALRRVGGTASTGTQQS